MMFLRSENADAELIGHVIILGLTIIGIGLISVVGVPTIFKLQDMAIIRNVEQTYTLLDSRASSAIIGSSPLQTVDMNLGGGTLAVEPNGTAVDNRSFMIINSTNFSFIIPMGKLRYHLGDRIIAYEGGGVWSKYPSGGSVMLSPPEFHYNGWTLTLPIVNLKGSDSIGGKGTASISFRNALTEQLFPNASNPNMTNPVNGSKIGKVYVNITSEFYDAWAEYAKSLVYTKVSTNSTTNTAYIELTVVPNHFGTNTSIVDPIIMRGYDPSDTTPLDNFTFWLEGVDSSFNWQMTATSGTKTLIYYMKKSGGGGDDAVDLVVGFRNTNLPQDDSAELWRKERAFKKVGDYIEADFLNTSVNLDYSDAENAGATSGDCTKIKKEYFNDTDFTWDDLAITETTNQTQSIYNITQHYLWVMSQPSGTVSFSQCSPAGRHGPEDDSLMLVNYSVFGALTYLDITRNDVNVSII